MAGAKRGALYTPRPCGKSHFLLTRREPVRAAGFIIHNEGAGRQRSPDTAGLVFMTVSVSVLAGNMKRFKMQKDAESVLGREVLSVGEVSCQGQTGLFSLPFLLSDPDPPLPVQGSCHTN